MGTWFLVRVDNDIRNSCVAQVDRSTLGIYVVRVPDLPCCGRTLFWTPDSTRQARSEGKTAINDEGTVGYA